MRTNCIRIFRILSVTATLVLLVAMLAWRFYFADTSDATEQALEIFSLAEGSVFALPLVIAAYVAGGLIFFPVTALIVGTGYIFNPVEGFLYAMAGVLTSTVVGYLIGLRLGHERLQKLNRKLFSMLANSSADRGIMWIVIVRNIPIAPFSLVNMYFGSSKFTLKQLLIGTALGMGPSIALLTYVSDNLDDALAGGPMRIVIPLVILTAIALSYGLKKLLKKFSRL